MIQQIDYQQGVELRGSLAVLYELAAPMVLIEGRRGTSKTTGVCKKIVDLCAKHRGSRHLIVRQTRESLTESVLPTLERVIGAKHPEVSRMARTQRHSYNLCGSEIVLGGLDTPSKLYSTEWDTVYVSEAIETSKDAVEQFRACMRHYCTPVQQIILDTNPGPPGHWLNRTASYCPDDLRKVVTREDYRRLDAFNAGEGQAGATLHRLISVHHDNPMYWDADAWCWTEAGRHYVNENLASLTGHRRSRFFEGLWVGAEGGVYEDAFSLEKNVIEPFRVPPHWPVWVYCDPGEDHPCAIGWFTISITGKKMLIAEVHSRKLGGVAEYARLIHEKNAAIGVTPVGYYLDPRHGWQSTAQAPIPIVEQFSEFDLHFMPAPRFAKESVFSSVEAVRRELKTGQLLFFADCPGHIADHQSWSYKRDARGDVPRGDDAFEDRNDDGCFNVRAFIANQHKRESPAESDEVDQQIAEFRRRTGQIVRASISRD